MRQNLPVTLNEFELEDDIHLVSQTDIRGRITSFNDRFVEVSGFEPDELLGAPHNIVRHPDMPPAAFGDLWATLKAGRPWTGLVKNRRKNGDFYWVRASVSPTFGTDGIDGFVSIRTKPTAAEKAEAEAVYRRFREGAARGLRLSEGRVRRAGWLSRLHDVLCGSVRRRVAKAFVVPLVPAAAMGIGAIGGLHDPAAIGSLLGLTLALAVLMAWLLSRAITGPIAELNRGFAQILAGDFNSRLRVDNDDELSRAVKALQNMQIRLGFSLYEGEANRARAERERREREAQERRNAEARARYL